MQFSRAGRLAQRLNPRSTPFFGDTAELLYDMNFAAGDALHADFTYTRTTSAWRRDNTGTWEEVGSGVLRFHHDAGGAALGILVEEQRTSYALHNRDLTQTEWVKTDVTAAKDATGIGGETNSASTLTASGASGTALQSITLTSGQRIFQPWVKRKTGSGTIEITIDGGATWVDITSSINATSFTQVETTQSLADPEVGFRITTSGDEIEVDFAELQNGTFATSPVETAGSAVTRNADVINGPNYPTRFSVRVDAIASTITNHRLIGSNANDTFLLLQSNNYRAQVKGSARTFPGGFNAGAFNKTAFTFTAENIRHVHNGGTIDVREPGGDPGVAPVQIGHDGQASFLNSTVARFKLWDGTIADADLQSETS